MRLAAPTSGPFLWMVNARRAPFSACWEFLDSTERLRADNYLRDVDRRSFVVTRAALRCALSLVTRIDPKMFRLQAGRWGKLHISAPELPDPPDFSVSHSDTLSLVAISSCGRVGIDVERLRHIVGAPAIAKDVLGDRAAALLFELSDDIRDRAFLKLWTAAEAVAKATGLGWAGHDSISISASDSSLANTSCNSLPPAAPGREWSIASLDVGPDYVGSLVMEWPAGEKTRDTDLRLGTLNLMDMI